MGFWGVSNAARVRYRNQSTSLCRTQVGHMASLAKKSIAYTLRSYPGANLWNPKLKAGVTEVHWSVEIQQPIPYLCLIPQLSKSMVQPHCCCRLTWAEINGFRAGRCVWWRPPSLHDILFIPYDVHLHFLLFTCFFWNILSYLTQIHQIQNVVHYVVHLWKWKDLSAVSRKFFWSVEIEQPLLVAKLTRAEINGLAVCRCVGAAEPPWNSLHSIWCPSPLPALHMFLLKYLVILDPNSSNSKRSALRSAPMKMERLVGGLTQVFLKRRDWTASVGCKLTRAEINGLAACRCVGAAEPPWHSHSI